MSSSSNAPLSTQSYIGATARDDARAIFGNVYGDVTIAGNSLGQSSLTSPCAITLDFPDTGVRAETLEEEARECRNALFFTDPAIDRESLISAKGKRVAGTCEWIAEDGAYRAWLEGVTRLLWICGGPGKGKTMLAIYLTQQLEKDQNVVYFFCSGQYKERLDGAAILRTLL